MQKSAERKVVGDYKSIFALTGQPEAVSKRAPNIDYRPTSQLEVEIDARRSLGVMEKTAIIILLLVGFVSLSDASARAANDWEYWSQFEISHAITDRVVLKIKPELRYNEDFDHHYYSHVEVGCDWKISSWFVLGSYYRYIEERKKSEWKRESRPQLDATFKKTLFGLMFSDRNRLEYRDPEDRDAFFRYRNKFTVAFPPLTRLKGQFYIAEEPYYDFYADEWNKNRLYIGMEFRVVKNFKAGLTYILESRRKNRTWTNHNV